MLLGSKLSRYRTTYLIFILIKIILVLTAFELSANSKETLMVNRQKLLTSNERKTSRDQVQPKQDATGTAALTTKINRLPLYFVRNDGQFEPHVKFYAVDGKTLLYFTTSGVYFSFNKFEQIDKNFDSVPWYKNPRLVHRPRIINREVIKMMPIGVAKDVQIQGEGFEKARFNYFLGNNPKKWRSNVPAFRALLYKDIYPGIDLKFYGNDSGRLEYDLILKPGADPSKVKFAYEGIQDLQLDDSGNLLVELLELNVIQKKPRIFQKAGNVISRIDGKFNLHSNRRSRKFVYGFKLDDYDKKLALFIDPVISYSTYLGGSEDEFGRSIAVDDAGSAYITGVSLSTDFPTTPGSYQTTASGIPNGFISKFDNAGNLIYSTYLGGNDVDDCLSIGVDSFGSAYVSCVTTSPDYPTLNPFQANWAGQEDIAVTKLNSDGSALIYSTYLGGIGRDILSTISIDSAGNAFVAGVTNSTDFPLQNALQPNYGGGIYDGFITELNNVGNALVYSTYLGGSGWDDIFAITVDSTGAAYLAGDANDSPDFPTTPGAFDTVCGNGPGCGSTEGCDDATVSKIAPLGQSLVFSTFLGGDCIERAFAIDIDSAGAVYVTGDTLSDDFPLVNPIQATLEGQIDAFVTKLSPDGSELIYSTFLGGNDWDTGNAIAVDSSGAAYVAGRERSTNFPTVNALSTDCGLDGFITRVSPQGDAWDYSTCLGGSFFDEVLGITVDETGTAYIAGYTLSTDFPIRNAAQPNNAGEFDAFVTKIICDSIKGPNAVENSGLAVFTVDLCIPRSSDVTINYSTSDGSAIAGEDYVSTSEPLIIPAGETSGTIQIQILDDSISESDENFFLDFTSSNVDFGLSRVEATIRDNDGLLFDDFENHVMNWQVVKGQWIETNGTLIGIATNAAIAFAPIPWSPSSASGCSNCTIEIDMETAGGSFNKVIVEGWYQDNRNRVELILNEEKDKWILKQRSGGSIVAKAKAAAVLNPQVRYDVLLSFDGSNFSLIVNGSQILTMQAAAAPSGKVGLKVKKTTGTFGQIRVY